MGHDNASITCALNEADDSMAIVVSREDQMGNSAKAMEKRLPPVWDIEKVSMNYPTDYNECLNTTLVQESVRFNNLVTEMHKTLKLFQLALKGLVVLSADLEKMGNSIFAVGVPALWEKKSSPSLKPLTPWYDDLLRRLKFLDDWIVKGAPAVFWFSGFFFPQGFVTANQQNYARKNGLPIDTISNSHVMMDETFEELTSKPEDGCYVDGLFAEAARWDK